MHKEELLNTALSISFAYLYKWLFSVKTMTVDRFQIGISDCWLVGFYGTLTLLGYLMPIPVHT